MTIPASLCYEASTRPKFLWNSPKTYFFVNYETKIQNIIFDGSNLISVNNPCENVNQAYCCLTNDLLEVNEDCISIIRKQKIDLCESSGEGMFKFEYWPDFKWTQTPLLTIEVIKIFKYLISK
jgi:hypothetical protein